MLVNFPEVMVLGADAGQTKNNRPYCILKFMDETDFEVYKVWCFGDAVAQSMVLSKGSRAALSFKLSPVDDGGVRLVLDEAQRL